MKVQKLYKYMQKQFADEFLSEGKLRIGTLYDFRDIEKHGPEIGDEGEGTQTAHYTNDGHKPIDSRSVDGLTQLANMFGIGLGGGTITLGPNAVISGMLSSTNLFIFCVSHELNQEKMKEMGYDSCIEINNPEMFFNSLSLTMSEIATPHEHDSVCYQDRHIKLEESIESRSYLIKPDYERFVNQKEYRFVWLPRYEIKDEFIDIICPDAAKFCKRII